MPTPSRRRPLSPRRLERHPLTTLDRGRATRFRFRGTAVDGFEDEPIGAALYADGTRVLSRSMRYHRARGYFCGVGICTHCFVNVNGRPNVRACEEPCGKDAWVDGQNAYPNVEHDVMAMGDLVFRDYFDAHRRFIRPAFLKPLYTKVIRAMAGFGKVPQRPVEQTFHEESLQADVCVVGGGPAGLSAAEAAAKAGAKVLLLDRQDRLGGRLRFLPTPFHASEPDAPRTEGKEYVEAAHARLRAAGVEIRSGTRLFGIYPERRLAAASSTRLVNVRARSIVLATGSYDEYRPFPGSDRAGVLLVSGALRLLNRHGVVPGEDVAIVGAQRDSLLLARDLMACGSRIATIIDPRLPVAEDAMGADLRRLGQPIQWSTKPVRVIGRKRVRGLEIERGRTKRVDCDSVVLAGARHAAIELFQQAGCKITYDTVRGFYPETSSNGQTSVGSVFAAGSAAGAKNEWQSVASGERAGLAAAQSTVGARP
jgi:sarcosine oxidase, subunit alpha